MIGAIGAAAVQDLTALYTLKLSQIQGLNAPYLSDGVKAIGASGVLGIGTDSYVPSLGIALGSITYNRLGQLSDTIPQGVTAQPANAFPGAAPQFPGL